MEIQDDIHPSSSSPSADVAQVIEGATFGIILSVINEVFVNPESNRYLSQAGVSLFIHSSIQ